MISPRRTFIASLLGCSVLIWNGSVWSQNTPVATGTLDAAAAASNTSSLPPPAPLPPATLQALNNGAPAGMPGLPPASGAPVMPALPPSSSVPPAGPGAAPIQGAAAPLLTLPSLPAPTQSAAPIVAAPVPYAAPPVIVPRAPQLLPDVVEPVKSVVPVYEDPLVSTAFGGPLPPTIPHHETFAIERLPLPRVTPISPLIPGRSLAETTNQRRHVTTLPGSGGDTSYAYATIGGPDGPAPPLITPPSIVDTKHGHDIGKKYPPLQAVMPLPEKTPFHWDELHSAFGTPNPPESLTYYQSKSMRRSPDLVAANPAPINAEIIVLRGGQEFQGLILERGDTWRVEMLNGTIITVPGRKVSHVRKLLAAPTSTPTARRQVFPPQALYIEQMTN